MNTSYRHEIAVVTIIIYTEHLISIISWGVGGFILADPADV